MSIISTVWAGSARPPRSAYARKWLAARLVRDEQRKRLPITLPGRPVVAKPTEPSPPSPPTTAPRTGWLKLPEGGAPAGYREMDPVDVLPPYTREQLVRMNDRFVHRLERAFARGRESRTSAASFQPEKRYGGYGMPLALTDDQLATLRQFATPIPPRLRDAYLRSVARRLAGKTIGDGTVHTACIAAQHEVINGARAGAA